MEVQLYKKYNSLRKVSRLTGIPVSTLWHRLEKKKVLHKKTKVISVYENSKFLIGLYVGIWAGDGSRYYSNGFITKIHVHKKDRALITLVKQIIEKLFHKKINLYLDGKNDNRAALKIHSKFIYHFAEDYLKFSRKKAQSVRLKEGFKKRFLDGFLLGLTLTDGYLKDKFIFTSVSKLLANQVARLLHKRGLNPKIYMHNRKKYHWHNLFFVSLKKQESSILKKDFDVLLEELGTNYTVNALKRYENNEPAAI